MIQVSLPRTKTPASIMAGSVSAAPLVNAGKVKAFANAADRRNPLLPNVPAVTEVGYPEMAIPFWHALYAPAATVGFSYRLQERWNLYGSYSISKIKSNLQSDTSGTVRSTTINFNPGALVISAGYSF